jgi:hypothetical protein
MSFNRTRYDAGAAQQVNTDNTSTLNYTLYPGKFMNDNPCRINLGILGGNNVSLDYNNMVDIESSLRGQTLKLGRTMNSYYQPSCSSCPNCMAGLPCGCQDCQKPKRHLPTCQMMRYPPTVLPTPQPVSKCVYKY